jgi:hypothetical protein
MKVRLEFADGSHRMRHQDDTVDEGRSQRSPWSLPELIECYLSRQIEVDLDSFGCKEYAQLRIPLVNQ